VNGIRLARNVSAGMVAAIAAWSSYSHMTEVALRFGERAEVAYVLPFSVDGLMVVASVTMVDDKQAGRRPRTSARAAFLAGVLASVGANIAAAHPGLGARIVAGWPALALLLVVEMLSRSGKSEQVPAESSVMVRPVLVSPGRSGGVLDSGPIGLRSQETKVEAMTRTFQEVLAAGRVPDHRELAKVAGADVSHARRVHQRLVAQQSS
jgi:hypothetical protein